MTYPLHLAQGSAPRPLRRFYARWERPILGALTMALFLLAWEGLARGWWADLAEPLLGDGADALRVKPIFLSSPSTVAATAWDMYVRSGSIWNDVGLSALEFAVAMVFALAIGIPAGLVSGRYRLLSYATEPLLNGLNALPQIALLPLIVLWMGTGLPARIFIVALLMIVPILLAAHAAVRTVDPRLLRLARAFCASERQVFRSIVLPSAVPLILAGVRLAIGRGMIGIVVGEIYGSSTGLGAMMNRAGSTFRTAEVFVGVLTLVVAGLVMGEVLKRIERRFGIWRGPAGNDL